MNTTSIPKRPYHEQFKRDAVALLEGGPGAVAAAVELAAMQREVTSLPRENDILKMALAIVAQQEAHASNSRATPSCPITACALHAERG